MHNPRKRKIKKRDEESLWEFWDSNKEKILGS
jgi:hypothetical protein